MTGEPAGRASLLTPVGRGAVAVIAAEGAGVVRAIDAAFVAANGRSIRRQRVDRIVFGRWNCDDRQEEVVVIRGGDGACEIHCHGGVAAAERILAALAEAGCLVESWRERLDRIAASTIEAEADAALAQATTRRTAAILLVQREGALRRAVEAIIGELKAERAEAANERLDALLARGVLGTHLVQPWRVAIAGRPNVGKSSLINALVGYQRAIVFDEPGTTRDVLTADTAIDGWPIQLADAAGIRATNDDLEAEGVSRARRLLAGAELALWILDATTLALPPHEALAREWEEALGAPLGANANVLPVVNKVDLAGVATAGRRAGDVPFVSALTGEGVSGLLALISRTLIPDPPKDEAVPFTPRQLELLSLARASIVAGQANEAIGALNRL